MVATTTAKSSKSKSASSKSGAQGAAGEQAGGARLLLLDGHSLAYRAFFALPTENFTTTSGQTTNAVYGFTSMLINLLRDEAPTHVCVAFDVSRQSFRSETFAAYKANRSATPNEFHGQIDLIKDILATLNIPVVTREGFEADDVIATLTTQAVAEGMHVSICTGDRDAFQLVSDQVTVLYPRKGVSDLARYTPEAVQERYTLTPEQYPDFAALRGDPSDNLPSIPGVGEKTAQKWIREFGSLDALVERVDEVRGKAGDALREHLSSVVLNRQLTELVRDVELDVRPEELEVRSWDRDAVHRLFDELEFRVLRERLFSTLTAAEPEAEEGFEMHGVTLEPGAVGDWLDEHARDGARVGISFHGTWGQGTGDLHGVALAAADGEAASVDVLALSTEDETALAAWLADPQVPKAAHEVKGPMHAVRARGWQLEGVTSDTALAAYLARPGERSFDLADLVLRYLRRELRAEEADAAGGEQLTLDGGEEEADETAAQAEMLRARAVADLADALDADLAERGGTALLTDLELPLLRVLADLEAAGVAVDISALHELESEFGSRVQAAAQSAYDVIGKEINLGSPKQLQVVLFDELQMPKTKRTKTGYTTDADALQTLNESSPHPFLEHLLEHRDATRLRVTVKGLLESVTDDGRIHTTFNQTIARTGRLSSTEPNLQNIPVRTEAGRRNPGHLRRRGGLGRRRVRRADDRGLRADRDADHGAPLGRRGADRVVQVGRGLPLGDGGQGVRCPREGGQPGPARQDQGDELRPGVRTVRLRAIRPAAHVHRRGQGADGGLLRPLRRRARLPVPGGRPGPQGRLHQLHPRAPALPARPHHRQPAAPGDGRADGAQRAHPGQRGRHRQGRDARGARRTAGGGPAQPDAAPGARRTGARGGAGGAGAGHRAGPPRDGGSVRAGRPAGGLGRVRPLLGPGGALTKSSTSPAPGLVRDGTGR